MPKTKALIDFDLIASLYKDYAKDLAAVRADQSSLYRAKGYWHETHLWFRGLRKLVKPFGVDLKSPDSFRPQLDDIEAEITYMLIRKFKPKHMVEISPAGGWSTTWILSALRDNGFGHLYSFDLVDTASKNVPTSLQAVGWSFFQGDVKKNLAKLPKHIDYLFLDSDHSGEFALWFIKNLFSKLKPSTPVSVHDVYHSNDLNESGGEGQVLIDYLVKSNIPYFTASRVFANTNYTRIMNLKSNLGLDRKIHSWTDNSMVFFTT